MRSGIFFFSSCLSIPFVFGSHGSLGSAVAALPLRSAWQLAKQISWVTLDLSVTATQPSRQGKHYYPHFIDENPEAGLWMAQIPKANANH